MSKIRVLLFFFIVISTYSQVYEVKNGTVTFYAISSVAGIVTSFDGTGDGLSGTIDLEKKRIILTFDLWTLKTGISLRDDHMHENYLQTEKYPKVTYLGTITKNENNFITSTGVFELHGVKKRITVQGKISNNNLVATWDLKLGDYKINTPRRFLIAKISSTLKLTINTTITELQP